ncbi:MAG TPA: C25 family cysteine peptidase [Candidatus Krumholzibacteria bacterium]|nr:C25 family cysteine peptidase [Candidatus Krumholzibacteria bacterium]
MRKPILAFIAALGLSAVAWLTLRADTHHIDVSVRTSSSDIPMQNGTGQVSFTSSHTKGFSILDDTGKPALPMRVVNIVLPNGRRVDGVTATPVHSSVLASDVTVKAAVPPQPEAGDRPAASHDSPALAPATSADVFPSELVRYLGSGKSNGYTIASFAVFPVRAENARIVFYDDIDLHVTTSADGVEPGVRAERATERTVEAIQNDMKSTVLNPEDASGYTPIQLSSQKGPFQPTGIPSLEGSPVEYVIITTAALAAEFDSLATWKTAKGVPTVVKTVEWIEANYRRGTDRAETVRYFIQDAYAKWGVRWVLIGGDTQEIPARYFYSAYYYGGTTIPCDMYYACLDGDFNADHDAVFGEQPADSPDLYPEVYVGRLPVSTTAAAHTIIGKIMRYETPVNIAYADKVLYLAEVLFPAPWNPGDTILENGADIMEYLHQIYITSPLRRIARCYEAEWLYPGSVHESRATAIDSMQAGYNQVFHIGHGYRFNMHCGDDNVAIPDADALTNTDKYFNLYMLNCTAAAFDYDCLGEHLLRNARGGAVSVLGSSNSAFADVSAYYMDDYVDRLYLQNQVHIGEVYALARGDRTPLALAGDNADLWTHYIYAILADPEMPMWTTTPKTPAVTHVSSVAAGVNNITVTVTVSGVPRAGVSVCLWKNLEDYQVHDTNVAGQAAFTFNTPSAGTISVVATDVNMVRYQGSINVTAAPGAMPVVESLSVDDDSIGGTSGNGNGVIDAGETVDLKPAVRNKGGVSASATTATLTSLASDVTVLDATAAVPTVAAGALVNATDSWRVHVNASAPDEESAEFFGVLTNGVSSWISHFSRNLHAPKLEVTALRKSDQAPVGDGNGTVSNGEKYLLYATIKNYGTGQADGLGAVLRAQSGGSTVIDSLANYPVLLPLGSSENTVGFKMSEADVSVSNPLRLVFTDSKGRVLTHNFELREPLAPTLQSFDASLGVDKMMITWISGASTDIEGYNIYRATSPAGPYTRANSDVIAHTVFTDAGLASSTRYYYTVATVDQSGNEGPRSAPIAASTNPPQLAGWPNELVDPSSNSPTVGDIDGYGKLEVVTGNDKMYAWHDDGKEVTDGDHQGITWGVLSSEGDDFVGPAALGNLDSSPGFEIAAAAYTSQQVFCFHGDGTVMPGWPKPTIDFVRAGICIGDIDGDGQPEIVAVDQKENLYAWHKNGTEVIDGDNNPATNGVFKHLPDNGQWQYQMPALADIDNDGKQEIIIATQDMKLYVFNETGGNEPGWPVTLPNYAGGGIAVGDIDNNGSLEIVVTVRNVGDIIAYKANGTELWHTWINSNLFFNPSPVLADLTGDGKLEALCPSSNGRLYAIQYDGSYAPGWPVFYSTHTYTESSPVVGDVNGDGSVDVLLGSEDRFINGWSSTGVPLDGFPLVMKDAVRGTPAICDLNKDGKVDIVGVGYDKTVYTWALNAPYNPAKMPWPMYKHDAQHSDTYGYSVATAVGDAPARTFTARLDQNYPNPFNPTTRIAYEVEEGARGNVTLAVFDVTGARVRTLVDEPAKPGAHAITWDGRNNHGDTVGSGIYFYRLTTPARTLTRKMVLLK